MSEMAAKAPKGGDFAFSPENLAKIPTILAKYPAGRQASAVMPLLDLAQRQLGWVSPGVIETVAKMLDMAPIRVYEVASFYTMYNTKPVGRYLIQVCRTTPCWLRGADDLTAACRKKLGIDLKQTTPDGLFTLVEVECLGACCNAPMVQINDDFYEDLTPALLEKVIDDLTAGRQPRPGSQSGRQGSCPEGGPTTLRDLAADSGASGSAE